MRLLGYYHYFLKFNTTVPEFFIHLFIFSWHNTYIKAEQ